MWIRFSLWIKFRSKVTFSSCQCFRFVGFGSSLFSVGGFCFFVMAPSSGYGGGYNINNFIGWTTWRLRSPDGDGEMKTLLSSWTKSLEPCSVLSWLYPITTKGLRDWDPSFVFFSGRKTKKEEEDCARIIHLQECWSLFSGEWFSSCLLGVRLCGLPYDFSYRSGIRILCNATVYSASY